MKRIVVALWVAVAASFMMPQAEAGKMVTSRFLLPGNGGLRFTTPGSWNGTVEHSSSMPFPTIHFSQTTGAPFDVLLTPMWSSEGRNPPSLEAVRGMVESTAREAEPHAVEKQIKLKELRSKAVHGYYFFATDRAPKPGEFRYMDQGIVLTSNMMVTFTILTNDGQGDVIRSALTMIKEMEHDKSMVSLLSKNSGLYRIAVPLSSRSIQFPSGDYRVDMEDNARPYYLFSSRGGVTVSFNFEKARKCNSSEACRDFLRDRMKSGGPAKEQWSSSKLGDVFVSEYTIPSVEGIPVRQHNLNAHYVVDGIWIDMHLSKMKYSDADRKLFTDFVRSVSVN